MTGYTVHYSSNGVTNSVSGLPSSATSHEITGLTNGRTYSISVEATSIHLSGGSETETITLRECFFFNTCPSTLFGLGGSIHDVHVFAE